MIKYIILIVTIIFLIFLAYNYGKNITEYNLLPGFWETNNSFNEESGLKLFNMYIGNKVNGSYPIYILMIEDDDEQTLLINEPSSFSLYEPLANMYSNNSYKEVCVKFNNLETKLIPTNIKMKFYPNTSKIILSDNKKIYAIFFKNPVLSELS